VCVRTWRAVVAAPVCAPLLAAHTSASLPSPSQEQSFHQQMRLVKTHADVSFSWALERGGDPIQIYGPNVFVR